MNIFERTNSYDMDELRQSGAIPELLGRFVTIVNYAKLTEEAIDKVIDLIMNKELFYAII